MKFTLQCEHVSLTSEEKVQVRGVITGEKPVDVLALCTKND